MAKGGFKRKLKIEDGKVTDHRPVNSDEDWPIYDVPVDVPATLNAMIAAGSLSAAGKDIRWPTQEQHEAACEALERSVEPEARAVLLEALVERAGLSANDLARARQSLIDKRRAERDAK